MLNANANYIGFGNNPKFWTYGNQVQTFVQGDYQIIKFYYQSGSTDPINGTGSFILPDNREVEFFVVAGGGTGGVPGRAGALNPAQAQYAAAAGGGGAGAVISGSFYGLKAQQYQVIAGAGGVRTYGPQSAPTTDPAKNGAPSIISGTSAKGRMIVFAPGGGGGGSVTVSVANSTNSGSNGGSGGGAGFEILPAGPYIELNGNSGSIQAVTASNVTAYTAYQNAGGIAVDDGGGINSLGLLGAGGGATTVGGNGSIVGTIGVSNAISASSQYYAGGGAGGYLTVATGFFGVAGQGGGGGAANTTTGGTLGYALGQGVEGTGGGGAAAYSGGSGVVILKFRLGGTSLVP
jgi:hypothetical protein